MSAAQTGGNKDRDQPSGTSPGAGSGRGTPNRAGQSGRPATGTGRGNPANGRAGSTAGRGSAGGRGSSTAGRPPSTGRGTPTKSGARRPPSGPGGRPASAAPGRRGPSRLSPTTIAFSAIAVVVVVVLVVVLVKVTGGNGGGGGGKDESPPITTASASVVSAVTSVPASVQDAVGTPSSVGAPTVDKGQPPLTINGGTPGSLFIGAEFCPFCAAERWAIVMSFSRFGQFTGLKFTQSSPFDTDPLTPTFTFRDVTYTSTLIHAKFVEAETNDTTAIGTRKPLEPVTTSEQALWTKYEPGGQTGYPFLDIDNKVLITAPSYDPQVLSGLTQQQVAADLSNPNSPVTQAIVGTANYMTAGICSVTGQQPAAVCSVGGVTKAAKAMGLS